jgi:hypothetical protein
VELKHLISQFTYRIEPKPEGGFIAHANDPSVPPLEAATREELQTKIQSHIATALASQFPGLKLPLQGEEFNFAFHVEHKPGGGFVIQSADPNAKPVEGATHAEIESQFAEKLLGFVGKHFTPELAKAFAAQGMSGNVKVLVNRKTGLTVNSGSHTFSLGIARDIPTAGPSQPDPAKIEATNFVTNTTGANINGAGEAFGNSPITPEPNNSWPIFRFLLALLVIATLTYFFVHHR